MEGNVLEISRESLTDTLLKNLANVLTKEDFLKYKYALLNASDSEFNDFVKRALDVAGDRKFSEKDLLNEQKRLREKNHVDIDDSGFEYIPIDFLPKNENENLLKDVKKSSPSDHIFLDRESDYSIMQLWENDDTHYIPSDVFFAGTIPLQDCLITVDERNDGTGIGMICDCRIVVFNDYAERIENSIDGTANVGVIIINSGSAKLYVKFYVCKGVNEICFGSVGYDRVTPSSLKNLKTVLNRKKISEVCFHWLETWYGIQIALLHPLVKTVFQKSTREVVYNGDSAGKRKRKTCYVKKHIIKADDIEKAQYGNERNQMKRKTLVWYVIGHWRHYSDGKKVFVKPYWKGPLRDLKKNLDDGREREIAVGGEP